MKNILIIKEFRTSMNQTEDLVKVILKECEEDYVGLWSVIRIVEDFFPNQQEVVLREQVLELIHDLLTDGKIYAGCPLDRGFQKSKFSPEKIIDKIKKEWNVDNRPSIGDIIWFTRDTFS